MNGSKFILGMIVITAGTLILGCAKRQESAVKPVTSEPVTQKAVETASSQYTVASRDTLWGIAGKSTIYSDNFQWPLIFKANRDMIKDPDLIYPKQEFKIEKGASDEEVSHAKSLAMKTPKYVPHTEPRTTLPIDYF